MEYSLGSQLWCLKHSGSYSPPPQKKKLFPISVPEYGLNVQYLAQKTDRLGSRAQSFADTMDYQKTYQD